jgi:beta-xylosidase
MVYASEEHIAIACADHPLGPFKQENKHWLREGMSIDGSFFVDDDGTVYLYYVRLDGRNRIFVAKMKDDLSGIDEEYPECLIEATSPWETLDCSIAEGPFTLKHKGLYYLTYSANGYTSQDYAVGYATATSIDGEWTKYEGNPILRRYKDLVGTGHHTLFKDKRGRLRIAFHAHQSTAHVHPRTTYIGTMKFTKNGVLEMTEKNFIRPKSNRPDIVK